MSVDTTPDATQLGGWAEADDVCDATLDVQANGSIVWLRCEVEGEHEEHEATLRWKTPEPEPTG